MNLTDINNGLASSPSLLQTENKSKTQTPPNQNFDSDTVTLSSQGQKLQQISSRFFASGAISSQAIPELVQELHSAGFLNDEEANRLGVAPTQSGKEQTDAPSSEARLLTNYLEKNRSQLSEEKISDIEQLIKEL
ncbi:hypothetical protein [Bermanella sp. R86510]|uniref:hypothetical protein n=1 Tax=unclassified Bermanella TaxID=2627862 RepID=UPI0037C6CF4A